MKSILFIFIFLFAVNAFSQSEANVSDQSSPGGFTSDGCSWFPDGNYRDCCVAHDEAYFRGGSWEKRLKADNKLFKCVAKKKGWYQKLIAPVMWAGVRVGGLAILPTKFRWGFGKKHFKRTGKAKNTKKNEPSTHLKTKQNE